MSSVEKQLHASRELRRNHPVMANRSLSPLRKMHVKVSTCMWSSATHTHDLVLIY